MQQALPASRALSTPECFPLCAGRRHGQGRRHREPAAAAARGPGRYCGRLGCRAARRAPRAARRPPQARAGGRHGDAATGRGRQRDRARGCGPVRGQHARRGVAGGACFAARPGSLLASESAFELGRLRACFVMERIRQRRHACSAVPGPASSTTIPAAAASLWPGASDGRCLSGLGRGSIPDSMRAGAADARGPARPWAGARRARGGLRPHSAVRGRQVLTPGQAFKLLADAVAGGPAVLGRGVALLGVVRVEAAPVCGNGVRRRAARARQLRPHATAAGPRVATISGLHACWALVLACVMLAGGTHARCRIPSSLAACMRALAACRRTTHGNFASRVRGCTWGPNEQRCH